MTSLETSQCPEKQMEVACTMVAVIKMKEHLMNLSCISEVEPMGLENGLYIRGRMI